MSQVVDHLGAQLVAIETKRDSAVENHLRFVGVLDRTAQDIRAATAHYTRHGVVAIDASLVTRWKEFAKDNPRSYFRALSAQMARPFAYADETRCHFYRLGAADLVTLYELQVTRSARTSNITAGLLLIAKVVSDRDAAIRGDEAITRCDSNSVWRFYFRNASGKKLLDDWLHLCRTDPIFRVVLKANP